MKPILYISIGLIFGYLLCRQCSRPEPSGHSKGRSDTVSTTDVDTGRGSHDMRPDTPTVELLKVFYPVYDTLIVGDTFLLTVDTAAIIADYLKSRIYRQTYLQDSMYTLEVTDTISANKLFGQGIKIEVYNKTVTNTVTNTVPQTGLLLGLAAHGPMFGVSGLVGWQFRGQTIVGGYDVVNRQGQVGVMWRVGR